MIFNRSWYNRAGVEVVNGFSTAAEQAQFLRDVPDFERMLVESGIALVKLWLDIIKDEQAKRLEARRDDPLKALKVSPLDAVAQDKWDEYSAARDAMLLATHTRGRAVDVRRDRRQEGRAQGGDPAHPARAGTGGCGAGREGSRRGRAVHLRGRLRWSGCGLGCNSGYITQLPPARSCL